MVNREDLEFVDYFNRPHSLTTTPTHNGWTFKSTGSTPTGLVATADGGGMVLTLTSTSENQYAVMYHNDVLCFDVRTLQYIEMIVKVSGIDAVTALTMGVASAWNATDDSIATNAWFRMQGSASTSNLVVETDDAVTDNDDVATGATLSSVLKTLRIDFCGPAVNPTTGTTNLTNVRFSVDGEPVARGTTFSMAGLSSGLNVQPFVQLSKASGTGTPTVTIKKFLIRYTEASGA